jgi:hypothetical protein
MSALLKILTLLALHCEDGILFCFFKKVKNGRFNKQLVVVFN